MSKQVLPQAPSPTMTSFLRISAMVCDVREWVEVVVLERATMLMLEVVDGLGWALGEREE